MKKLYITIAFVVLQLVAVAQTVNVHFKNGQTIVFPSGNVEFVDFSEKAPDPTVSAGAVVDLGLSVYWCSCNVGAESPEEYGDYYAWGETKPKSSYLQKNYAFYDDNTKTYTNIGNDISGTEYDAATANLGNDWRMPTKAEIKELRDNCTWEWVQIKSINGYKVTGSNGNSIFIPAAGFYLSSSKMYVGEKDGNDFWSATSTSTEYAHTCNNLYDGSGRPKYYGLCIRPVTSNPNAEGGPVDHSSDYLVTDKISASIISASVSKINGVIRSGSSFGVKFSNASDEAVTLIGIEVHDSGKAAGSNLLSEEVEVAAGESKSYTVTLGSNMTTPVFCFTYRYNKKKYTAEVTYSAN